MTEYLPILIIGAIIGTFTVIFIAAWIALKKMKDPHRPDRHMPDGELIRRMAVYAKPYWKQFVLVFFVMLISVSFDILAPAFVGDIQGVIKSGGFVMSQLYGRVAIYGAIMVLSLSATYVQSRILHRLGQKILSGLRQDLFAHIESLSHEQLNNIPVGKLVTRVCNDTAAISTFFTNVLVQLVKNVMVIFGVLGAMLVMNYAMTLMVLCFTPFVALFTYLFSTFARRAHRGVTDARTDLNTYLSENLSGMKITQIFNREEQKMEEFRNRSHHLLQANRKQMFVFGIFRPTVYMLFVSCNLCLFYFGAKGAISDFSFLGQTITSEVIVAFYMYISRFFNPIQTLAEQFNALQSAFASAEKIFSILDMVPQVTDAEDAIELENIRGEIEFKDVWFAYKPDEWVLKGVSFHVQPHQTVAFVGSTGSGKTTILSLICRNYDIQKGQILIDGIDIRKIKISSLRRHFGQMLQDVFLFSGTIRSNILLRKEDVTDEEVMQAARYVNADKFIDRLESGLDEVVRERGNNFSAGQRQLLSFARTIVHKPSVMILDEATANIDTETEVLIQDSLEKMKNIGTMLIVAHRLSTIQHADNIIVLSKGKIVEQGNHQQLLEQKGRYHQLYTLQFQKQQLKNS